jgi:hypothetical protein
MCQHDQTFRIENEANGGAGCPKCNAERNHLAALRAACSEVGQGATWYQAHTPTNAEYERMSAGLPDGLQDEYSSSTEGHW